MAIKSTGKIKIILITIIILPVVFFSIYEVANYRTGEKEIEDIYNNQLEAILYSINQFSQDKVDNWASKINNIVDYKSDSLNNQLVKFLDFSTQVKGIAFANDSLSRFGEMYYKDSSLLTSDIKHNFQKVVQLNSNKVKRLISYLEGEGNYRKTEIMTDHTLKKYALLIFITDSPDKDLKVCCLVFDSERFINESLGNRIQNVSKGKFNIAVIDSSTQENVLKGINIPPNTNFQYKKALWLLPAYQLAIQLKGETIEDLIKQRTYLNLFLIIVMDLVLLIGAGIVFKNVKNEIRLAQIKSEFISNVSHEIRTPLALINMYIETLEMGRVKNAEKTAEYYKVISNETKRLSGIVNKILNFSQIESGKRKYKLEYVDINDVVEEVLSTYETHIQRKGFTHKSIPDLDLPMIQSDRESLTDAIINLLDNAMKYSKDDKHIEIHTGFDKGMVYVEVEDHGIGISEQDQKLIFDKFYRVTSGNLAHHAKGTGLGLTIVRNFVEANNGKISVKSSLGKGSCFRISFPAAEIDSN